MDGGAQDSYVGMDMWGWTCGDYRMDGRAQDSHVVPLRRHAFPG